MKIYYDRDADIQQIRNKNVAVIGYGSQGHAHALNMKESGVSVVIGLREGASWKKAEQSGLKVMPVADAVKASDVVMILAPDEAQAAIYRQDIAPNLKPGSSLAFGHGFNIHFGQIVPPPSINVFMVAPKGPGHLVRTTFTQGGGVPCLIALKQDASGKKAAPGSTVTPRARAASTIRRLRPSSNHAAAANAKSDKKKSAIGYSCRCWWKRAWC